ncbi:hypothetical protein AAFF_G00433900 [Aldrovandia affinis]|uniref:Uncharacterized protein n=1 Tax=Aldrovandia affinis TaxID=143900 RepID=A0AAD7SAC8_9TELE|nr:hypothetical protein AAFF_G00433900 [Aldrovandia affinis]
MQQAQENEKRAEETEKGLKDELRQREEKLKEKIEEREKEVEETRERYEHSERQRAELKDVIEQVKVENAELIERIVMVVKERDEFKQQYGQREREMEGMVREKDKDMKETKMELNELQRRNDEKERDADELRRLIEEREKETFISLKKCRGEQKQREEAWREKHEKMESVLEAKEKAINEQKLKCEESERRVASIAEGYEDTQRKVGEPQELILSRERELGETRQRYGEHMNKIGNHLNHPEELKNEIGMITWTVAEDEKGVDGSRLLMAGSTRRRRGEVCRKSQKCEAEWRQAAGEVQESDEAEVQEETNNTVPYQGHTDKRAQSENDTITPDPRERDKTVPDQGETDKITHSLLERGTGAPDQEEITQNHVAAEEISQNQMEVGKITQHRDKTNINTHHEKKVNKINTNQCDTTPLHKTTGEMEERAVGIKKEKQGTREEAPDHDARERQSDIIKQENKEWEEETTKPKWRKGRHRARERSKEEDLNHHGDRERVEGLTPTNEARERRVSEGERNDACQQRMEERRPRTAMIESAACKEKLRETSGNGALREGTELKEPKPTCPQRWIPNKPTEMIARGSSEETHRSVLPAFPPSPESPSPVSPEFPLFQESPTPSELRLVLLGESWAFNSSARNVILGRGEAGTEQGHREREDVVLSECSLGRNKYGVCEALQSL